MMIHTESAKKMLISVLSLKNQKVQNNNLSKNVAITDKHTYKPKSMRGLITF